MIKTATKSQTFGDRYGNADPITVPEARPIQPVTLSPSAESGSSGNTNTTSVSTNSGAFGTSLLDFLNNGVTNVFGWLGLKQQTVQNNANMSFEYSHEDQKTRRTRTIILGLVAVAVVVGAIIISKKKK